MTVATTYFSGLGNVVEPGDQDLVLGVVRRPQEFIDELVDRNSETLAPPEHLLDAYKSVQAAAETDGDVDNPSAVAWHNVSVGDRYRAYVERAGPQQVLDGLRDQLRDGRVVWLVCWERDVRYCHRRLLADVLVEPLDGDVIEHYPSPEECRREDQGVDAVSPGQTDLSTGWSR